MHGMWWKNILFVVHGLVAFPELFLVKKRWFEKESNKYLQKKDTLTTLVYKAISWVCISALAGKRDKCKVFAERELGRELGFYSLQEKRVIVARERAANCTDFGTTTTTTTSNKDTKRVPTSKTQMSSDRVTWYYFPASTTVTKCVISFNWEVLFDIQ